MKKIAGFVAALAVAGVAHAAEPIQIAALTNVDGKVLIHKGKEYTVAKAGSSLVEGDRVITLKGSKADVAYKQGCITSLKENAVLAIEGVSVCETGPLSKNPEPVKYAQAIGAAPVTTTATTATTGTGTALTGLMIGGTIVAGGTLGVSSAKSDGTPISGQ